MEKETYFVDSAILLTDYTVEYVIADDIRRSCPNLFTDGQRKRLAHAVLGYFNKMETAPSTLAELLDIGSMYYLELEYGESNFQTDFDFEHVLDCFKEYPDDNFFEVVSFAYAKEFRIMLDELRGKFIISGFSFNDPKCELSSDNDLLHRFILCAEAVLLDHELIISDKLPLFLSKPLSYLDRVILRYYREEMGEDPFVAYKDMRICKKMVKYEDNHVDLVTRYLSLFSPINRFYEFIGDSFFDYVMSKFVFVKKAV